MYADSNEEVLGSQKSPINKTPLDGKEFRGGKRVEASTTPVPPFALSLVRSGRQGDDDNAKSGT
jgi:hypothetical protein